jgi:tripartite-type tricarboxylate transporter receptor subunit TctC
MLEETPMTINRRQALAVLATSFGTSALQVSAQEAFPARPVKLILPVVAGNGSDVFARALAKELGTLSGHPFVIDNRPGGNSVIAARAVIQSPADGYTLFFGTNASNAANVATLKDPGFDPVADFTPIALAVRARPVLTVGVDSPYKSIEQLVAAGRRDPELLSAACGSVAHQMLVAMFARGAGMKIRAVPYKGTPQAIHDTVGNQVSLMIADAPTLVPMIQGGKLRALVVTSDDRLPTLPDVPTVKEKGLGSIPLYSWAGLYAPARTPPALIQRLTQLTEQALKTEAMRKFAAEARVELAYMDPSTFSTFQKDQIATYRDAVALAGIETQ